MSIAVEFIHPADRDRICPPPSLVRQRLDELASKLRASKTADSIFDLLVSEMPADVPFDRLCVAFLGDEEPVLMLKHLYSNHPVLWDRGESRRLLGSSLEPLFAEGAIRLIHDLGEYQHLRPSSLPTKQLVSEGMRSSMAVPLYYGVQAIGVLFFTSCQPQVYTLSHVADLALLAPIIGQAFGRALGIPRPARVRSGVGPSPRTATTEASSFSG